MLELETTYLTYTDSEISATYHSESQENVATSGFPEKKRKEEKLTATPNIDRNDFNEGSSRLRKKKSKRLTTNGDVIRKHMTVSTLACFKLFIFANKFTTNKATTTKKRSLSDPEK